MNTLFDPTPEREAAEATPLDYRAWRHPSPGRRRADHEVRATVAGQAAEIARLRDEIASLEQRERLELEEARAAGAEEAREQMQSQVLESLEVERTAVAHACASLARERTRYFADMQREVVRLAVAIAERVLHRTLKEDPAATAQVVHVAVSQLAEPDAAVLHVPAAEFDRWKKAMRSTGLRVEPDDTLPPGGLRLESMGGAAELGWKAQLDEIERSFDDLLERKQA